MSIVFVVGCGRSGTNMILETLSGSDLLKPSENPENKNLFKILDIYKDGYLTKTDTCYINDFKLIDEVLNKNPLAKILFTIRDPRDMMLSKIRRGQPFEDGGDCKEIADDATINGCIYDMEHALNILKYFKTKFSDKLMIVKMEDYICDQERVIRNICDFCKIEYKEKMKDFMSRMRNSFKKNRYNSLDKNELYKWKNWENIYDGWFVSNNIDMNYNFELIKELIIGFKYNEI